MHTCITHKDEIGLQDIHDLVDPHALDDLLEELPDCPSNISLAVLDALVPTAVEEDEEDSESEQLSTDRSGYSSYTRLVVALVHYFLDNRQQAKTSIWIFRHFFALSQYADEKIQLPSANNPVFPKYVPDTVLRDLQTKIQQLVTYVFSSVPDQFLTSTLPSLLDRGSQGVEGVAGLLHRLIYSSDKKGKIRESRSLHTVLRHLLSSATKDEADKLLTLARKLEKTGS